MNRWFHKEDGGLIKISSAMGSKSDGALCLAHCLTCEQYWQFWVAWGETIVTPDWVRFSDLPEDLQSVALSEML